MPSHTLTTPSRLPRALRLRLKFELLAHGLDVPRDIETLFERCGWKLSLRTRSGASGGLDLQIDDDLFVNAPINAPEGVRTARWRLVADAKGPALERGGERVPVRGVARPAYYDSTLADGTAMVTVGQQCSADRVCIGLSSGCFFWRRDLRCTFCSIGANTSREARTKSEERVCETVVAALNDPLRPARHVLLGGGTPNGADFGAAQAAALCRAIKAQRSVSVYAMLVPPPDLDHLQHLREAGVDELGLNLEFTSDDAARRFMPGKFALVGPRAYHRALAAAARVFGPVATRSLLIVGLEAPAATLAGVRMLCDLGVMPILSPFRALEGTDLERHRGWDAERFIDVYEASWEIAHTAGLPLGPTCIPCQSNTLALPEDHPAHMFY